MQRLMKRPVTFGAGAGLMRNEHFQVAYATNDLERACDIFRERFGIGEFTRLGGALPEGGEIDAVFAWVGSTMYEVLTASGPGSEVYMDRIPAGGFAIRHHHLCYLIHEAADWDALGAEIAAGGYQVRGSADIPGFLKMRMVDVPEVGHYLEYIFPEPSGLAFLESIAAS